MSKTVLITGASSGIGQVTANYLHQQGLTVVGTSRQPEGKQTDYEVIGLDVTDQQSVSNCVQEVIERHGKLDILINNAGFGMVGGLAETTIEELQQQFETNFFGVHRMVRACVPHFRKQGSGMIINMGSFGGRLAIPYQTHYSASKAALAFYSDGLRMELMREGLVVTCIEPGDTKTDFDAGRRWVEAYQPDPVAERAVEIMKTAESNGADPLNIAKLIAKLIRRGKAKPRYTTGIDAKLVNPLQRLLPYSMVERGLMLNYKIPRK